MPDYDVIVVGVGNAAFAAAVSARENGAQRVVALEKAPAEMRGGNTYWSGAILRFAFDDANELAPLLPGIELIRCATVFDDNGRFNPRFVAGSEQLVRADTSWRTACPRGT